MQRWMIGVVGGLALALGSGCVAARVREVPRVDRTPTGERDGGLVIVAQRLQGATLDAAVQAVKIRSFDEVRHTERIAEYEYLSAAVSVWDSVEHPAAKVAVLPLAVVGGALDVAAWVLSAPFAYSAGAIGAIDAAPTAGTAEERAVVPLPAGTTLTVRPAFAVKADALTVQVDAQGRFTADLDAIATAALRAGQPGTYLEIQVQAPSNAQTNLALTLEQLCDAVAPQIERDRELRRYRWQTLLDACPVDASAVRSALQARLDAGP